MKAIKLTIKNKTIYAQPLTFGQLEDHEDELKAMFEDAAKLQKKGVNSPVESMALLRKQLKIITLACVNHDPDFSTDTAKDMTMQEIALNFPLIISGSGMVEVEPGEN